jgi:hypothetical protein
MHRGRRHLPRRNPLRDSSRLRKQESPTHRRRRQSRPTNRRTRRRNLRARGLLPPARKTSPRFCRQRVGLARARVVTLTLSADMRTGFSLPLPNRKGRNGQDDSNSGRQPHHSQNVDEHRHSFGERGALRKWVTGIGCFTSSLETSWHPGVQADLRRHDCRWPATGRSSSRLSRGRRRAGHRGLPPRGR